MVTGEFPTQRPVTRNSRDLAARCWPRVRSGNVTRSFDVFFDLCLNKRLSKQS